LDTLIFGWAEKAIVEVELTNTEIEVDDGENVSNATKRMCIYG
jgi:hypothetical protein